MKSAIYAIRLVLATSLSCVLSATVQSHVVCSSNDPSERVCRVKNLFYDVQTRKWGILSNPISSLADRAQSKNNRTVDLTSIKDHNRLHLKLEEFPFARVVGNINARVAECSHLLRRFMPNNLMHVIHDDWLGGWFIQQNVWPKTVKQTVFIDQSPKDSQYNELYALLANNIHLNELVGNRTEGYIAFEDAIVGNSKELIWYQYGFKKPQAPLNRSFDHSLLKKAAHFFVNNSVDEEEHGRDVLIFSRSRNRRIVNEALLREAIEESLKHKCEIVRLEEYSGRLQALASRVKHARAIVGMHGAMLALGLWLPQGSVLLELFPFAVPAEDYQPYRKMCELVGIKYLAWENKSENTTITYPNRPPHLGGTAHLSMLEREAVEKSTLVGRHKCCRNSNWLYRIYQDTIVDINGIVQILKKEL